MQTSSALKGKDICRNDRGRAGRRN